MRVSGRRQRGKPQSSSTTVQRSPSGLGPSGLLTGVVRAEPTKGGGHLPSGTDRAVRRTSVRSVEKTSGRAVRRQCAHTPMKTPSGANWCRENSLVKCFLVVLPWYAGSLGCFYSRLLFRRPVLSVSESLCAAPLNRLDESLCDHHPYA